MDEYRVKKVAVVVLLKKDGKILLGRRIGEKDAAAGLLNAPGGHLEYLESFEQCAVREIQEEVGVEIENLRFLCVTNVKQFLPSQYVVLTFEADLKSGEPQCLEPDRCEGWDWYELDKIPENLTPATRNGIVALQTGRNFFDA